MSSASFDVAVVGAGIVGAACAHECARAGLSVAVVEANHPGGGATAAGMGHVVVMDDSEAQFALTRYSQRLWVRLAEALPPECEFNRCGTIWIAADADEMELVHQKHEYYVGRGVHAEILDAAALARAEPNLRAGLAGGLFVRGDLVVYPPAVARWLIEQAQKSGAKLHRPVRVVRWEESSLELSDSSRLGFRWAVNATGSWAAESVQPLSVRPRKGHLVITDRYPDLVRHQLVELGYLRSAHATEEDSVAFNIQPRLTSQALIGSSRQFGVSDPRVDPGIVSRMLRRAQEYFPGLADVSITRVWTGLRAATPDALPLIGPDPQRPGVLLATGHEGLGITTSLGTARLIADQIVGRSPAVAPEPYLPSRFAQGGNGDA